MKFSERLEQVKQRRYGKRAETPSAPAKPKRPVCAQCKHYYITWDRNFPYGCKAMGFKARTQPSIEVFNSSGIECQMFTMKEKGDG